MKTVGLIPSRLNSSRLPQKPLLEIEGIPLVIHTYRRAKLSKKLAKLPTHLNHLIIDLEFP